MSNEGILGIKNRTENWKTVEHFHGLSDDAKARIVAKLLGSKDFDSSSIEIQSFWYGFRDYIAKCNDKGVNPPSPEQVGRAYRKIFEGLQSKVSEFRDKDYPRAFATLQPRNYSPSEKYFGQLFDNLRNTEADIVIRCGNKLLIGEAKYESSLNAESKYVLVHQLIRQHVMAKILVDIAGDNLEVQHFLVGDACKLDSLKNTVQVKFMKQQKWLRKENVLSWDCIAAIAEGKETRVV